MIPRVATSNFNHEQRIAAITVKSLRRLALRVGSDFDAGWARVRPSVEQRVQLGRAATVHAAIPYTGAVLAETGQVGRASGTLVPAAFLDRAPSGAPVMATFDAFPIRAKQAVAAGKTAPAAVAAAAGWLGRAAVTMLADTRRDVFQADIVQRPQLTGYVRMISPGACDRCIILAGEAVLVE